ncbi:hypothetical protein D3C78_1997920 [compost metagenome]
MLRLELVYRFVDKRYIRAFLQMVLEYLLEIHSVDMLTAGEYNIFGRGPFEEIQIVMIML